MYAYVDNLHTHTHTTIYNDITTTDREREKERPPWSFIIDVMMIRCSSEKGPGPPLLLDFYFFLKRRKGLSLFYLSYYNFGCCALAGSTRSVSQLDVGKKKGF